MSTEALKQAAITAINSVPTGQMSCDALGNPCDEYIARWQAVEAVTAALTQATASEQGEPTDAQIEAASEGCTVLKFGTEVLDIHKFARRILRLYAAQPAPAARPMPDHHLTRFQVWFDEHTIMCRMNGGQPDWAMAKDAWIASKADSAANAPTAPAVPADFFVLDDDAKAMIVNSHHYTPDNIRALIERLKAFADPQKTDQAEWDNLDWRGFCNVLWRVMMGLACDLPAAPAAVPEVSEGWRQAWETARQACKAGISEHRGFEIDAMVESTIISRVLVAFEALHVSLASAPTSTDVKGGV
jgi:hypothetical protein